MCVIEEAAAAGGPLARNSKTEKLGAIKPAASSGGVRDGEFDLAGARGTLRFWQRNPCAAVVETELIGASRHRGPGDDRLARFVQVNARLEVTLRIESVVNAVCVLIAQGGRMKLHELRRVHVRIAVALRALRDERATVGYGVGRRGQVDGRGD